MEKIYYLFGEMAVNNYNNDGINGVIEYLNGGGDDGSLYSFDGDAHPTTVLSCFVGCLDFKEITKKEYDQIKMKTYKGYEIYDDNGVMHSSDDRAQMELAHGVMTQPEKFHERLTDKWPSNWIGELKLVGVLASGEIENIITHKIK